MTTLCIDDLVHQPVHAATLAVADDPGPEFSRHARARMRRLGVSEFFCDLLLRFGNVYQGTDGNRIRYFGRGAFRRMERYFGAFFGTTCREGLFACYLVESADGRRVLTLGFLGEPRQRRLRHGTVRRPLSPTSRSSALPRK